MVDKKVFCVHCKYVWKPREGNVPKACPRCKRYDWDKPKITKSVGGGGG